MDFDKEIEDVEKDQGSILGTVSKKLKAKWDEARAVQTSINNLEEVLSAEKDKLRRLTEEEMPELFSEAGVNGIILETGECVQVDTSIHCGIPADRKEEAFSWLRDNNHGDLIKNELTVKFGRSEGNLVGSLKESVIQLGLKFDQKEKVEPMTLKAFIKEQMNRGESPPQDLFGVFIRRVVKVK